MGPRIRHRLHYVGDHLSSGLDGRRLVSATPASRHGHADLRPTPRPSFHVGACGLGWARCPLGVALRLGILRLRALNHKLRLVVLPVAIEIDGNDLVVLDQVLLLAVFPVAVNIGRDDLVVLD